MQGDSVRSRGESSDHSREAEHLHPRRHTLGDLRPQRLVLPHEQSKVIDADRVHEKREELASQESAFRPFVFLNACHAGVPAATAELEYLGRAFVEHGAVGVLGPQIEIPQLFASEYAYAFLDRYLTGSQTAGEICRALVRYFLDELHSPLALAYLLYCGIEAFWRSDRARHHR
jgi:hypothetical protein